MFREVTTNNTSETIDTNKIPETLLVHYNSGISYIGRGTILAGKVSQRDGLVVYGSYSVSQVRNGALIMKDLASGETFKFKPGIHNTGLLTSKSLSYPAIFDIADIRNSYSNEETYGVLKKDINVSKRASELLITMSGTQEELDIILSAEKARKDDKRAANARRDDLLRKQGVTTYEDIGMEELI